MPIYSDQTLAEMALRKIGALDFGQSAPAEQMLVVSDRIDGLLAELATDGVYPATAAIEIEPRAFDHVAAVLANRCRDEFGIAGEAAQRLQASEMMAIRKLRSMSSDVAPFGPVDADYF
jgi:hypothetical protein